MNINRGFTLIEVILIVAIVAIMTAVAIPAWLNIAGKNRKVVNMNTLHNALIDAQGYASMGSRIIVICKAADPDTCPSNSSNCCTTTGDWSQGWVIFQDFNDDQKMISGDGDVFLQYGAPLPGNIAVTGTGNAANWVKFLPGTGYMPSNNLNEIIACPAGYKGSTLGRTLHTNGKVSNTGGTCN